MRDAEYTTIAPRSVLRASLLVYLTLPPIFWPPGYRRGRATTASVFDTNRPWSFLARETQLYCLRNKRFCRLCYLSPVFLASHRNLTLKLTVVDSIARK
jgi:hypothetical protein